jgi:hypothetical protein
MKTYYVCREGRGSNSNSGDKDRPLATLDYALSIAKPGDRVVFSTDGGVTFEEFRPMDKDAFRKSAIYSTNGLMSWVKRWLFTLRYSFR